jgi:hypothetical protein
VGSGLQIYPARHTALANITALEKYPVAGSQ